MKRIALIEDDPTVREELALLLENEGYQVLGVTDFTAVPRQVQAFGADLVLLDLGLPGKDGFALCAALRRESPVPIIIVTSRDAALDELEKETRQKGRAYMFDAYRLRYMEGLTAEEVAEKLNTGKNSPARWCKQLNERLAVLLFGVDGLRRW